MVFAKKEVEKTKANRDLLLDKSSCKSFSYLKEFNKHYESFCDLSEMNSNDEDINTKRIEAGKLAAKVIAYDFEFNNELISEKKKEYIKFARDMLYEAGNKPNYDSEALIYLIRAYYGQTSIAYSHSGENKEKNIKIGNDWVDHIERNTKDRTLKAYALTLRCYEYMVNGQELGMSVKERLNKSEKDLLYATKWDEDNYLAYYALGLLYSDNGNSKYNKEKAIENFTKVTSYKNKDANLDNYLDDGEKDKAINNAKKKIDLLNK